MGLAVTVGILADMIKCDEEGAQWVRDGIAKINAVLAEKGLPTHDEPEELPEIRSRCCICGYPYSFLHYLRRVYARFAQDSDYIASPFPESEEAADDPVVDQETYMFNSHLLCHSDCEGYYFPIPFDEIIVDETDQNRVVGGMICSSYHLRDELVAMAPCLRISLEDGELTDAEADRINGIVEADGALWIEHLVWLDLYESARLSIEHKSAIHFG